MKNFKLVAFVVMASLCGQQVVALEPGSSSLPKITNPWTRNAEGAVKTIFTGKAFGFINHVENKVGLWHLMRKDFTLLTQDEKNKLTCLAQWDPQRTLAALQEEPQKIQDMLTQAKIIYGFGAVTSGSLGLTALYKASKSAGVKRLASGSVGGMLATAGLVAAYRITQL